jgi:hypothetical protein
MSTYLNLLEENNRPTLAAIKAGYYNGVEYSKDGRCLSSIWTVGESSSKLAKSITNGDVDQSFVIYLESGLFCPWMTAGCASPKANTKGRSPCLRTSGQLGMKTAATAGLRKTLFYIFEEDAFIQQAVEDFRKEIVKLLKAHGLSMLNDQRKLLVSVRLDGTSDLGKQWQPLRDKLSSAIADLPVTIGFYEYTKNWIGTLKRPASEQPYHITLSRHENTTIEDISKAISLGYNVAVVVDHKQDKPTTLWGFDCIDGDASDYRPNDAKGKLVLLSAKGNMKWDTTGFVVRSW